MQGMTYILRLQGSGQRFLTSFFPPIGSFFGTVMGIKKPVPQSVLLGQVNFRILRCHPAWCIPPTHAYIHMRNFVDGGFTPAPILCKAFPVALGSPFIKALRAAISPPATLWKEVSFYYLLFFNGLRNYSMRGRNPSSFFCPVPCGIFCVYSMRQPSSMA